MIFRNIYPGMQDSSISLLKKLLNELLEPSPNLIVNNKYDNDTKTALKRFEKEIGVMTLGNLPNSYNTFPIFPVDGKIDESTWIAIGMALRLRSPEKFRNFLSNYKELLEKFGLIPGTLELNQYPSFNSSDFKIVKNGLELAKKMVADSIKNDGVLNKWGIVSVQKLLDGVIIEGENANTFDGRKSLQLVQDGKEATKTVKTFLLEHKGDIGAIVRFYQGRNGTNVMFLGHFYFETIIPQVRAFIIMHEAVHLVGKKYDKDFAEPGKSRAEGSKELSKLLVETFFPVLKAFRGNLGVI